ncbi:Whole genome shotgun sequence [Vibrio crassostreae]|nr:Whole genome shotgun sequence [Vibrio crassostreae]CAK2359291.1 Whole genome shotgun sequence [Vibrio crassostreae]CAK2435145.1 Whole genome shotgun sequence [Vibrio crassostreae]CAK3036970.1 Whole genome shotgun sequence [Vibrio crassostreae]
MSFAIPPKTKLTQQDAMSESWEDKYPNKCPIWLEVIGWAFVFVPFFFN